MELARPSVEAVYGAVKKWPDVSERCIPLLASQQGGVAERSIKRREASADREAGVVFRLRTKTAAAVGKPPRLRRLRWLRKILLMTQPPLLAVMQGGE